MANLIVTCPSCSKPVAWVASSRFRPFCSDPCRLIDFGEWAEGNRYIPSDEAHDGVQDLSAREATEGGSHLT